MKYVLQNKNIFIEVNSLGAELTDLKYKNSQILYEKHPDFWQRQSPVLFPIVGGLKNKEYVYNNQKYELTQHGFARDEEFELQESSSDTLVFSLKSEQKFLEKFPFEFELIISYKLTETSLSVNYEVKNQDNKTMYYSLGGHPAFSLDTVVSEYSIDFKTDMSFVVVDRISPAEFLLDTDFAEEFPISPKGKNFLDLDEKFFEVDAMVFRDIPTKSLDFCKNNQKIFTFSFENFPHL